MGLKIEFERFLPSDGNYNIENSEVGDHHGLEIIHTMNSGAQLWSIDQAGTQLWNPAETTDKPEPYVMLEDGACPEGTEIMDGDECQEAAESLGLMFLAKYEDKSARSGCFFSGGFSNGVYLNARSEAPVMDDNAEYSSVCRLEVKTPEPTKMPVVTPDCDMVC